jgi:hypothetical protein
MISNYILRRISFKSLGSFLAVGKVSEEATFCPLLATLQLLTLTVVDLSERTRNEKNIHLVGPFVVGNP